MSIRLGFCQNDLPHEEHDWISDDMQETLHCPGNLPLDLPAPGGLPPAESVNHPDHYGGEDDPYEVIKVIMAWELGFNLGNAVKYIGRAGKKDPEKHVEDLKKARFYLDYEIQLLSGERDR